ncbi:Protein of unknown function [Bacillus cereus]|nr:Protein of unknown function [Bacillus cereus]
MSPFPHAY